ncbi:hypothetical protein [Parasphingorhabdus sp.]|uniref:hypothetical protein n=1 Tax=Parasphingorhabdus sp. TaxID=2709688 RepID=UPI003264843D
MKLIYPRRWDQLSQAPSARAELILAVQSLISWESLGKGERYNALDGSVNLFLDIYHLDRETSVSVGVIIFENEVTFAHNFAEMLSRWIETHRDSDNTLHFERIQDIPIELKNAAKELMIQLETNGIPAHM